VRDIENYRWKKREGEGLMFIREEVKQLAKDLVKKYYNWYYDKFEIFSIEDPDSPLWICNGFWFINYGGAFRHPLTKFNLIEKYVIWRAVKKCIRLNYLNSKSHFKDSNFRYRLMRKIK
jgi:hypothetical protein